MKEPVSINRRNALKTLAALTGAAITTLPKAWSTPELRLGALPAHAQTSGSPNPPALAFADMTVRLDWTAGASPVNVDLSVVQPDANYVGYNPATGVTFVPSTSVLSHSGDIGFVFSGSETVTTIGVLQAGIYNIVVNRRPGSFPASTLTVTITLDAVPTVINLLPAFNGFNDFHWVATVNSLTGVIDTTNLGAVYP